MKPVICLGFDGVIHDYRRGWHDGTIYGKSVPGFWTWAQAADPHFILAILTHRDKKPVQDWLEREWARERPAPAEGLPPPAMPVFRFPERKPMALLTIEDRTHAFDGNWYDSALSPARILEFKPWNVQ